MKSTRAFKPHIWRRFRAPYFHGTVVLNFTKFPKGEFAVYGHAYHEAAQRLVAVFASKRGYRDVDACPIVFLYRHALELYMKSIILWGNALLRLRKRKVRLKQPDLFKTHSLKRLVSGSKPIFRLAESLEDWPDPEFKSFKHFERILCELEKIDPGSYSFRYPIDRRGSASLPNHLCFNVRALGAKFDGLLRVLDGVATWAYEEFQAEAEVLHNVR